MLPRWANVISPRKILVRRLKWREERLDMLSPKEVSLKLHPRNTQASGNHEKPDANHHDTVGIHLEVSGKEFV